MSMTILRNSTGVNVLKDLLKELLMPQEFHVPASFVKRFFQNHGGFIASQGEIGQNLQSGKEPAGPDIMERRELAQFIRRAISVMNQERQKLLCLVKQAKPWNWSNLKPPSRFLKIETGASKLDWRAGCHGVRTGGPWMYESISH